MSQAFVLTDLGYGDSGKGTIVHWLSQHTLAHTVIRTGGCQAMHNVVTTKGKWHMFTQFGSGTLNGVRTHLSKHMVIDPYAIIAEGNALINEHGIRDAFTMLSLDRDALVVTPWQAIASRLKEVARDTSRYSTVGVGVGEAVLDAETLPDQAIRVQDLTAPWLRDKLAFIRELKVRELAPIIDSLTYLPELARRDIKNLRDPKIITEAEREFQYLAQLVSIVDGDYLNGILQAPGVVIFEPSQGVLLDRNYGWHPYTTKVCTTSADALALLDEQHYTGLTTRLGITRTYHTRHGNGPFVTESAELTERLPDRHNRRHPWQGSWRVGHLDCVALRYAINVCGGPEAFDGLVVTCVDRLAEVPSWQICNEYIHGGDSLFDIPVSFTGGAPQLAYQQYTGEWLRECHPNLTPVSPKTYLNAITDRLGVKVAITSHGPTENDKQITSYGHLVI